MEEEFDMEDLFFEEDEFSFEELLEEYKRKGKNKKVLFIAS